jgi:hypothetical protein
MKDTISKIYYLNKWSLENLDKCIHYFRVQNYDKAIRLETEFINQMNLYIPLLESEKEYFREFEQSFSSNILLEMLQELIETQDNKDYILLADRFEVQIYPFFMSLQEMIINKEEFLFNNEIYIEKINIIKNMDYDLGMLLQSLPHPINMSEDGYAVERASCGHMTLAIMESNNKYYLHSNYRIVNEAYELANAWYQEDKHHYVIYGLGFGYHIKELIKLDSTITVEIYESDINVILLACTYTDINSYIVVPNVRLIYDPDFSKLSEQLEKKGDDSEFVIHYPSLRNIKNIDIKATLENYFIRYSSTRNQVRNLNGNFFENMKHYNGLVDELKQVFHNKDLYIVAAGPSLDKNFLQLKEVRENSIVLATGTVFRKLLTAGITPDYVIVTDANERVYAQIAGLEECSIPMLILSTAFQGFAKNYQGKKYMICQREYQKAEEYASKAGRMLFNTGGSVSTIALDIGIAFHCKRIIFLGLDLAYTDHFIHAADTSLRELNDTKDLRQIEDINGNMIYTSKSLDMYRKWIENRIRGVEEIEFIDASEGGARIEGMKIMQLSDCISGSEISTNS